MQYMTEKQHSGTHGIVKYHIWSSI